MKVLLLGANGQLGRGLALELAGFGEFHRASRDGQLRDGGEGEIADLTDGASLTHLLERLIPDVIVNAAAYTAVDRAENEKAMAFASNATAVATMAGWAAANHALVVHYSTDYVFDGRARHPYPENAPTAPTGVYGLSKLDGERALIDSGAAYLIFRTAWVYAPHGKNFLLTMLRLAREGKPLRVVADQIGTPTTVALIARATAAAIATWIGASPERRRELEGMYHLVARGQASWYEFAVAIFHAAERAGLLHAMPEAAAITTADFPTPAQRPAYSVLDTTRFENAFDMCLPDWREGLEETIQTLISKR